MWMGEVEIGNEMETWNMARRKKMCPLSEISYPSFVEVRDRVFFELMSDERPRWNFASCCVVVVQTST
jgi:hypothetical protein